MELACIHGDNTPEEVQVGLGQSAWEEPIVPVAVVAVCAVEAHSGGGVAVDNEGEYANKFEFLLPWNQKRVEG